jgi:FAD/FMN-containing dehydrogenase
MADPTLIMRVELTQSHLGRDCNIISERLVGNAGTVLDAQWSHDAEAWRQRGHGWPRRRLTDQQKLTVADVTTLLNYEAHVPASLVADLLDVIRSVSK